MSRTLRTKVGISNLELNAVIGIHSYEKVKPQALKISACCTLMTPSDCSLDETICYARLRELVIEVASSRSWDLVEHLGHEIIATLQKEVTNADSVNIKILKYPFNDLEHCSVELSSTNE